MKKYEQKDLGYSREATTAEMIVTMENGSRWAVPVQVIADSRDENYKADQEDTVKFIKDGTLPEFELEDWASNNMNWSDVVDYAVLLPLKAEPNRCETMWPNADKKRKGRL